MYKIVMILAAIAVVAFGLSTLGLNDNGPPNISDGTSTKHKGITRHMLLKGVDLSDDNARHTLMLYPQATGDGMRVVIDQNALRAAQNTAFYTDDPSRATRMILLSILFFSPPTSSPHEAFASVLHDKQVQQYFTCYRAYCNNSYQSDTPHTRDLAGLLEASVPVELVLESDRLPDNIRATHFRALQNPDVVMISPPSLPAPGTVVFPARVVLKLPAAMLETDETGETAVTPFDEAEITARFTAAFSHAFPNTDAYQLGEMRFTTYYPPHYGWPVLSPEIDGYVRNDEGEMIGIDRLMLIEPTISVALTSEMQATLLGSDPFGAMPEFAGEPDSLLPRLNALAEATLGRPCPECFKVELPVASVDKIKAFKRDPVTYHLSYYRILEQ